MNTTMNINNNTTNLETKTSALLAQLGKNFKVKSIRKTTDTISVVGYNPNYISFHVRVNKITVLSEDCNGNNPYFKDWTTIKEAVADILSR